MTNEEKMYKLVCQGRFDKLDTQLSNIANFLFKGNGGKPLDVRMAEAKKDFEALSKKVDSRWKWLAMCGTIILIAVVREVVPAILNLMSN